jgi:hypothetical protein
MPVILRGGAWTARRIRHHCLRRHCHVLASTFRGPNLAALKAVCAPVFQVLETRSRIFTDLHPTELHAVPAVVRLAAYAHRWLRAPEDWLPAHDADPRSQWTNFLRHLLARYPVPPFLDAAWQTWGPLVHLERDCWCALAQGRSLREVEGFPGSVSTRILHLALTRGQGRNLVEAIWLAQLSCLGASPLLAKAVLSSRVVLEFGDHARWQRLVAKFAAGDDALAMHFDLVADTLVAAQNHRGTAQVEQLLRLPLDILIRYSIRFTTQLLQANGHLLTEAQVRAAAEKAELKKLAFSRWPPLLGDEPFPSRLGQVRGHATWRIEELYSVDALREESRTMNHCVQHYAHRCRVGASAIFSVRHYPANDVSHSTGVSCATVQVHPHTQKVVQIRAAGNRAVNNTIMTIIREWSAAHGLACTT